MAKQMVKERQDITGLNCIKGASGKVVVDDKRIRDRRKFGFSYGVSADTTQKYGFGLVSVTANRNGRITVAAET